jgi:2-aminobenzoate-CoA ligase
MPLPPTGTSAHVDTFARDHLPPREQWPDFLYDLPELQYPNTLNVATALLDDPCRAGNGDRHALVTSRERWTYSQLLDRSNRIARVLMEDLGLVPGQRVLLRAPNNPMMIACWFGVIKAGGIVVATMPLLRAREIAVIAEKARVALALCDERLADDLEGAAQLAPVLRRIVYFNGSVEAGNRAQLDERLARKSGEFENVATAPDDVCLIAFTSGTTGSPKGAMHFHRDLLASADSFFRHTIPTGSHDVFCGSPPVAFTFGLGMLVVFPMRVGASVALVEKPSPEALLDAVQEFHATVMATAPIAYRAMLPHLAKYDISSLKHCISAGETLPLPTWKEWKEGSGLGIIDGIGSTELFHIFITAVGDDIRPGATGKPVRGYQAMVVGNDSRRLPPGEIGRLAVRGPTGCRYLADERQKQYVVNGWNLTGDAYREDSDGYFWFQARTDDMIISSGYNISGPEVEAALLAHPAVAECAVVGAPDPERGTIVKAFVVPRTEFSPSDALVKELQDWAKRQIAPYKYPRAVEWVSSLPRTETGKVQRFRLREQEIERSRR